MRLLARSFAAMLFFCGSLCHAAPCTPPPPDMAAWWPLDETTGTSAFDLAGDHHGSYLGNPLQQPGQVEGALDFDRSPSMPAMLCA